jgi:EAL domain-containing protein (putative c-di-GMP-specific phosphodiesterase class I)/GGDEF domain-containing protein
MVAIAIIILVSAITVALRLQRVVAVTNDLIIAYSALDQWQGVVSGSLPNINGVADLSDEVLTNLPAIIGPQNQPSDQFTHFLSARLTDETATSNAQALKELLIWELFECHRLQNYYSGLVNLSQIALTLLMLAIGLVSYFMGRRAQDYRLAPFPEANPNPIFGLNFKGDIIYTNEALRASVLQYLDESATVDSLLPKDYLARLQDLKGNNRRHDVWIHPVKEHIFQYKIQLLPKFDRIHIYSEDITEQENIRARNAFIAYHDPVCLLANRQRLEQIVDELTDPDQALTLVMTFVSGMAQVLSTQGLGVSDQFAREYSIRLRTAYQTIVKSIDHAPVVFRFDANLFGCLYYCHLTNDQHEQLEAVLTQTVEMPFTYGKREFFYEVQSGAVCEPSSVSARQLIQQANQALHSISGKDLRYRVFDASIEAEIQTGYRIEQALRHAVELDELSMVYQPQQDLKSGKLIGFEALMRWQNRGETVSPVVFIPVAEKTGLIHSIGNWGLRDVLKQCIDWEAMANVKVGVLAVNVSAQEFARRDFIQDVEVALVDYPVDPKNIQLELTESLLIEDEKIAIDRMHRLKALGFTLAIDDFGTGYSSFSYLSRFPIDKLKIDRSFIVNMSNGQRDVALVAAMVDVAHQLGMKVIAEGVETEKEKKQLIELGCDQIQGYLYGKPMSASQATLFSSKKTELL